VVSISRRRFVTMLAGVPFLGVRISPQRLLASVLLRLRLADRQRAYFPRATT